MTVRIRKGGAPLPPQPPASPAPLEWALPVVVHGKPIATNRAYSSGWRGGRGKGARMGMFKNAIARDWQDLIVREAKIQMQVRCLETLDEPVRVTITYWFQTLASDVDGPTKLVLDALEEAGAFVNDNRVRSLHLLKPDPDGSPRVEILVEPIR